MKDKAVAIFTGVGLIAAIGIGASLSQQTQAKLKADHVAWATRCINVHNSESIKGTTSACEGVKTKYLSQEQQEQYAVAYAKHKEIKAKKAAEQKAANEKWRAEQKAKEAKRAEAKRHADAKFKAEGWWEQEPGIYVRWCNAKNPCPLYEELSGLHLESHGLVQGTRLW